MKGNSEDSERPPWAQVTELASERLFDLAVARFGGQRTSVVTDIVDGFENADWVFEKKNVIVEHKSIQTEVTKAPKFIAERDRIAKSSLDVGTKNRAIARAIQPFLAQIAKKANRQIRSTARRLGWNKHWGILILSNRNFVGVPPRVIVALMGDILLRNYSEISAYIYVTDHYVEIPGSDLANILWSPQYHPSAPDWLQPFINDFGATFFEILEEETGPFEQSAYGENPLWLEAATPIIKWK